MATPIDGKLRALLADDGGSGTEPPPPIVPPGGGGGGGGTVISGPYPQPDGRVCNWVYYPGSAGTPGYYTTQMVDRVVTVYQCGGGDESGPGGAGGFLGYGESSGGGISDYYGSPLAPEDAATCVAVGTTTIQRPEKVWVPAEPATQDRTVWECS